jgi:hypothetical protein
MNFAHYLFIAAILALLAFKLLYDVVLAQLSKEIEPVLGPPPIKYSFFKFLSNGGYRIFMEILVSLVVLASALYIILSGNYAHESQKWAFSTTSHRRQFKPKVVSTTRS